MGKNKMPKQKTKQVEREIHIREMIERRETLESKTTEGDVEKWIQKEMNQRKKGCSVHRAISTNPKGINEIEKLVREEYCRLVNSSEIYKKNCPKHGSLLSNIAYLQERIKDNDLDLGKIVKDFRGYFIPESKRNILTGKIKQYLQFSEEELLKKPRFTLTKKEIKIMDESFSSVDYLEELRMKDSERYGRDYIEYPTLRKKSYYQELLALKNGDRETAFESVKGCLFLLGYNPLVHTQGARDNIYDIEDICLHSGRLSQKFDMSSKITAEILKKLQECYEDEGRLYERFSEQRSLNRWGDVSGYSSPQDERERYNQTALRYFGEVVNIKRCIKTSEHYDFSDGNNRLVRWGEEYVRDHKI